MPDDSSRMQETYKSESPDVEWSSMVMLFFCGSCGSKGSRTLSRSELVVVFDDEVKLWSKVVPEDLFLPTLLLLVLLLTIADGLLLGDCVDVSLYEKVYLKYLYSPCCTYPWIEVPSSNSAIGDCDTVSSATVREGLSQGRKIKTI